MALISNTTRKLFCGLSFVCLPLPETSGSESQPQDIGVRIYDTHKMLWLNRLQQV